MGNDFSSSFITPLEAHKLIQFEGNAQQSTESFDSSILQHKSGILASHLLSTMPGQIEMIHRVLFRAPTSDQASKINKSDHVNAIAAVAALSSILIAIGSAGYSPSFFSALISGLGFIVCAFLINVSCVLQAKLIGRSQRTILSRYFVALCEGTVVGAAICWAKTYFILGFLLILVWVGSQVALNANNKQQVRPRGLDFVFIVIAIALASSNAENSFSPSVIILALASASLTASIALYEILRTAAAETNNNNKPAASPAAVDSSSQLEKMIHQYLSPFVDIEVLLFSGFARFVFATGAIVALFASNGPSSRPALVAGILLLVVAETFRTVSLSFALKTPIFRPVSTTYVDGVFDLCHVGHKNLVNFASTLGHRVVAGVLSDEDCSVYKRPPVMTTDERVAEVKALGNVSRVVRGAPCFGLSEEFLKKEGIDVVVCGEEYMEKPIEEDKYYHVPRRMGIAVAAPRTGGISTSTLIKRISERSADDLKAKDKISGGSTVKE